MLDLILETGIIILTLAGIKDKMKSYLNENDTPYNMSEDEINLILKKEVEEIQHVAQTGDMNAMVQLAEKFIGDPEDYWNLMWEYRKIFEEMPDFPPKELFLSQSENKLLKKIRWDCYNAHLWVATEKTPVLNKQITNIFNHSKPIYDLINLDQCSAFELKRLLEIGETSINFNKVEVNRINQAIAENT